MDRFNKTEKLLKEYKLNKVRINFLENQLKRFTPESHEDYIEYRMLEPGDSGRTPKFIVENGREVAELNKVEAAALEYRRKSEKEYRNAKASMEKELKELAYCVALVDDGIAVLKRINEKYRVIIEGYYINNVRMEDIAESIHMGKSRCYVLCREAVKYMAGIVFGEEAL